jgi:TRAP-type C4-dicarboxylate transport system substrate-binding protein
MGPEVLVMSLRAWESLSAEDKEIFRDAARKSSAFMRGLWSGLEDAQQARRRQHRSLRTRPQAVRDAMTAIHAKVAARSDCAG